MIRRLLFRRASQNVHVSGGDRLATADAPRVILCANFDAPRTGAAYNRLPMRLLERASRRFPVMASPTRIWFWSIGLLLIPIGARMAGVDATWLDLAQLGKARIRARFGGRDWARVVITRLSVTARSNAPRFGGVVRC